MRESAAALAVATVLLAATAAAGAQDAASAASAPTPANAASSTDPRALAVEAAVRRLREDPELSGKHRTHVLKWKPDDDKDKKPEQLDTSWARWLLDFARFLNDTSRLLVYGLVLVLVALLLVSLRHVAQLRAFRRRVAPGVALSHVRELDVRPGSLPDDIGAAAWVLWRAGDVQSALSLLYRGTLSRLIHRHAVPIGAATTEGECLDLARGRLAPDAQRYVTQVVRAWEASTYGGRALSPAMGELLCSGFATRLDAAPAAAGAASEGGA